MLSTAIFGLFQDSPLTLNLFHLLVNSFSLTPADLNSLLQSSSDSHGVLVIDMRSSSR